MTFLHSFSRLVAVFIVSMMVSSVHVKAQGGSLFDIGEFQSNGVTAMKAGKWGEALGIFDQAIKDAGGNAKKIYGSQFGWFWYHKGFCELKLRKYAEAQKSFEECYVKYPNDLKAQGKQGIDGAKQSINQYHIRSLLKWAESAQGAENYEEAIRLYKKFLEERKVDPARNRYSRGSFYIGLSISHFKLFKIAEGLEYLETAIENKESYPTPDAAILACFRTFVEAVIQKKDANAFYDFLSKHRADVTLEPSRLYEYSPIFLKLAAGALQAELVVI